MKIEFVEGTITTEDQDVIISGFTDHSNSRNAPPFIKTRLNWLMYSSSNQLRGALTADLLWDWLYVDELWIHPDERGRGTGTALINTAETYAKTLPCIGVWLWTQSWQAEEFYKSLGYEEFTRFENFPIGHSRIGFRKNF